MFAWGQTYLNSTIGQKQVMSIKSWQEFSERHTESVYSTACNIPFYYLRSAKMVYPYYANISYIQFYLRDSYLVWFCAFKLI